VRQPATCEQITARDTAPHLHPTHKEVVSRVADATVFTHPHAAESESPGDHDLVFAATNWFSERHRVVVSVEVV